MIAEKLALLRLDRINVLDDELLETKQALSEREATIEDYKYAVNRYRLNSSKMKDEKTELKARLERGKVGYILLMENGEKRESEAKARIVELQGLAYYLLNHHDKVADELEADLREHGWEIDYLNGFVTKNALKEVDDAG